MKCKQGMLKTFVSFKHLGSQIIVLTMIGISNSNKTSYRNGCQSRTR
jgi:hypothetical protein